jgi:hypothetical protein
MRRITRSPVLASLVSMAAFIAAACSDSTAPKDAEPCTKSVSVLQGQPAFSITTIDAPGAVSTSPQGINTNGAVVGWYVIGTGAAARFHGFVLDKGVFTTVDYPGADNTRARGIGPCGDLVGERWNVAEVDATSNPAPAHGFERTADGKFVDVHYPGHMNEILQRILADGTILGCRHDRDLMGSMFGIRITKRGSEEIDMAASMHNGAAQDGRIVGLYTNMAANNRGEGYVIEKGVFTPFLVPNAASTSIWDMNRAGDFTGVYADASGGVHGYVKTSAGVTTINVSGAAATRAFGMNALGDVVGTYVVGGVTHGFLATRTQ